VGVGVTLVAHGLAGLRASAPATGVAELVSCNEILEVRVWRPETVERVAGSHDPQGVLKQTMHCTLRRSGKGPRCARDV
jgi:hypothetical protein